MSDQLYNVQVTRHCEESLQDTAYSIAVDLSAPDEAVGWVIRMKEAIASLSSFPSRVQLTPDEPWHSLGIHRLPVGKYYIYFLILEDKKEVRVTDIVFQGMDQNKRLLKNPIEDVLP